MIAHVDNMSVFIRRPRPTDQGYIASTWVDSITLGNRAGRGERRPRSDANVIVDRLLDDPAVRILVAAEPTRTDLILGWICYTPMPASKIVHYIYVRDKQRRRGIASALLRKAFEGKAGKFVYTMHGPDTDAIVEGYRDTIFLPIEDFLRE